MRGFLAAWSQDRAPSQPRFYNLHKAGRIQGLEGAMSEDEAGFVEGVTAAIGLLVGNTQKGGFSLQVAVRSLEVDVLLGFLLRLGGGSRDYSRLLCGLWDSFMPLDDGLVC